MILHLILQYEKNLRKDITWERRENIYHHENRHTRTQLYKNIIHLSFQKYTSQSFPFIYGKDPSSVALSGRNQYVSTEKVQHNRKEFNFGPLVC